MEGELVHFEIVGEDPDKLAEFYTAVLGWKIDPPMEDMGGYRLIMTGEREDAVGGGLYKKTEPQQGPLNYYDVKGIEDTVAKARERGGQVVVEKMAVPGMGWMAVIVDPQGNPFGLWLTDENAG